MNKLKQSICSPTDSDEATDGPFQLTVGQTFFQDLFSALSLETVIKMPRYSTHTHASYSFLFPVVGGTAPPFLLYVSFLSFSYSVSDLLITLAG